jgi:outer membrane receptor protein involved in Fe transport
VTGKLSWEALDNLEINLKAEHSESDDEHFASLFAPELNCYLPGQSGASLGSPGWYCGEVREEGHRALMNIADLREGATSYYGTAAPAPFIGTQTETDRYLIEGILDLDGWALVARWADNSQELEQYRDLDRSPYLGPIFVNLFDAGEYQTFDDNAAELRVSSPTDRPLRGTAGAYYYDAENKGYQREFTGFCGRTSFGLPLINGAPSWTLDKDARNLAGFGSVEYDIAPSLTVAVEARYAKDTPEHHAANGVSAEENYYSFTPRVTVTWRAGDDLNIYGLVAKGNKPGGFYYAFFDAPVTRENTLEGLANGRAIIKEEEAWTYEIGAKTQWLDRRLTANVSMFYIDWTNQAVNQVEEIDWTCLDPSGVYNTTPIANNFIANAGESQVIGAEVELSMAVTEHLSMSVNYGLADTELEEFNSLVIADLTGINDPDLVNGGNASGNEAPNAPKHSLSAYAVYTRPLGDRGAEWFARTDFLYQSKRWVDAENEAYIGEPKIVNARIGIDNGTWVATIYADNMLDDDTPTLVSQFPSFSGFPENITSAFHIVPRRGRNYGLALQYRFGKD